MPLLKTITAPNGATLTYHRVSRAEVTPSGTEATVQSWPDEAAFLAGRPPLWNSRINDGLAPALLGQLEAALMIGDGDFGGATPISDSGADLEKSRQRQWAEIKARRAQLDNEPIGVAVDAAEIQLDADQSSRIDLMGAVMVMQAAGLGAESMRAWRCADNVMRNLTLADMLAAGAAIAARRQHLIETSDALWQQLQAAETVAAVLAVTWPT